MNEATDLVSLDEALSRAEFVEHHVRVVAAPVAVVWEALHHTRWSDLTIAGPLFRLRHLGSRSGITTEDGLVVGEGGPVKVLLSRPPTYLAGGRIGQPWRIRPAAGPDVDDLAQLSAYDQPGWLVYGTDFTLDPLPEGRTRLTTRTLCQPTDDAARRAFARYWRLIAPFSAVIRRDLLRAVARRAERDATRPAAP